MRLDNNSIMVYYKKTKKNAPVFKAKDVFRITATNGDRMNIIQRVSGQTLDHFQKSAMLFLFKHFATKNAKCRNSNRLKPGEADAAKFLYKSIVPKCRYICNIYCMLDFGQSSLAPLVTTSKGVFYVR